jgi:hypothetical protein
MFRSLNKLQSSNALIPIYSGLYSYVYISYEIFTGANIAKGISARYDITRMLLYISMLIKSILSPMQCAKSLRMNGELVCPQFQYHSSHSAMSQNVSQ